MPLPKKEKPRLAIAARELVAHNVRRIRFERGWQQELLSYEAGLHRAMVGHIENARRNVTIDTLEAIAGALDIEMHELFKPLTLERANES